MKRIFFVLTILFAFACKKNEETYVPNDNLISIDIDDFTYANSVEQLTKSGSTFETNWQNYNTINDGNGNNIVLPWSNAEEPDANLPTDVAYDIKKEDGWKLIGHSFNASSLHSDHKRYLYFYNIRTGVLKILYYLMDKTTNNNGVWNLNFETNGPSNKLLNSVNELAIPSNITAFTHWNGSNLSTLENKAFREGWNAFCLPISYYDHGSDLSIAINTYNLNTTHYLFRGAIESYSDGAIWSYGSSNSVNGITNDLVSIGGEYAADYINDKLNKTKAFNVGAAVAVLVEFGVNKLFNSFTGTFSKQTTTRSDLEFTTKGEFSVSGTSVSNDSSPITSIRTNLSSNLVGYNLGNWNLTDRPTIYLDPRADHIPHQDDDIYKEYSYKLRGISGYKYNIAINPDLNKHIISKWVTINVIKYHDNPSENNEDIDLPPSVNDWNYGSLGVYGANNFNILNSTPDSKTLLLGSNYPNDGLFEEKLLFKVYSKYNSLTTAHPIIFVPKVDTYETKKVNVKDLYLRVSLNMVTNIEGKIDTTITTRTFVPKIEWDPTLYNRFKNIDHKDLIHFR